MKPRAFIASSVEGRSLAYAAQSNLEHDAECTVWDQGVFTPSACPIEAIVAELSQSDFGIFVFSPDDLVTIRDEEKKAVRDNVVFELGLFMGRLTRERTFILRPRGIGDLRIPTDLAGIEPVDFETGRRDKNDRAALGPACDEIRKVIKKLGFFIKAQTAVIPQELSSPPNMDDNDAISLLEEWLAPNKTKLDEAAFVFSKVDAAVGLPAGAASRLLETAAKKFDYTVARRGKTTLKLAKGGSWFPSAVPRVVHLGSSRHRRMF
jgi:hypothetical protein